MSDGLMTTEEGDFHGNGFKKFLVKDDFFIAITVSQVVAEFIFNEVIKSSLTASSVKKILDDIYNKLNKEYNIVLGMKENTRFTYTIYTHFEGIYEVNRNIMHFNGYPIVMNSSNIDDQLVAFFKKSIKHMIDNKESFENIIRKQKEFHKEVAVKDITVNEELFHEFLNK